MMRIAVLLVLALSISAVCYAGQAQKPDCNIHEGPCVKEYDGMRVVFDASPRPVYSMRELTFMVTVEGAAERPSALVLDLSMPGMKMGLNRVDLRMTEGGYYEGKGVIVKCPSGRKLWKAAVIRGEDIIAEFTFDVRN